MFRQHAINRPQALLGLHGTIIAALRALTRNLVDPYRPERHYMRGPGPKCREKAALALQAQHQERLPPFSWIGGTIPRSASPAPCRECGLGSERLVQVFAFQSAQS